MAVITVKLPEDKRQDNALKDACISYVGGVLAANMRKTDTLGKYDEDSFAVIFAETGLKEAGQELGGLIERCEDKEYLSYEIGCSLCVNPEKGDLREKLAAARNLAAKKIFAAKEAADMPSARLGKYKASDLLNFNRKWKNHY
jgi:PleD family two-component response regulator